MCETFWSKYATMHWFAKNLLSCHYWPVVLGAHFVYIQSRVNDSESATAVDHWYGWSLEDHWPIAWHWIDQRPISASVVPHHSLALGTHSIYLVSILRRTSGELVYCSVLISRGELVCKWTLIYAEKISFHLVEWWIWWIWWHSWQILGGRTDLWIYWPSSAENPFSGQVEWGTYIERPPILHLVETHLVANLRRRRAGAAPERESGLRQGQGRYSSS